MPKPKEIAPYGTYGTLKSSIERFKESTVPTKLNRHVLHDVSGGAFSALISALRFFGMIDDNQTVKDEFRELVEAARKGEAYYKDKLTEIVATAYDPIIGEFDIEAGTLPDLEKKFRDAGIPQGQMITKATRFYLKALEDAGIKVSEHITKKRKRTTKPRDGNVPKKTKATKSAAKEPGSTAKHDELQPNGFGRLPIPGIDDGFIQYPKNLTDGDCTMFETMVGVLRTYVKSRKGGEGKKP